MKDSILQIAANMVEKVLEILDNSDLTALVQNPKPLVAVSNHCALDILQAAIEQADAALVEAKAQRKNDGVTICERNTPRCVTTCLGDLHYRRTCFENKDGKRFYLTDQLIGIEPYERVSKALCAELVQATAELSMSKSVDKLGVAVSRQTVDNKLLALKELAIPCERVKDTPNVLHIFADEDHAHMRPKRSVCVPLVTVSEGIDRSDEKRHRTIEPLHFAGYGMSMSVFSEMVTAAVFERYDMDKVERIYVHGDGAKWITGLARLFPNCEQVLDGFHLNKRYKQLFHLQGAIPYAGAIRKAVREDAFERFVQYCAAIQEKQDVEGRKRLTEQVNFFQDHWDAIVKREQGDLCGSCTEPLVSHILSDRLSRNPLAWSADGLRQMTMLRTYTKNGGVVTSNDVRVSRSRTERAGDRKALSEAGYARYRDYAEKQIDGFLHRKRDWSCLETVPQTFGKVNGRYLLLKSLSAVPNAFCS